MKLGSVVLALSLAMPVAAQGRDSASTHAERALEALVERASLPALSVAVARDGEIVWSEAFGYADLENRSPATPRTRFRIASISKALTGTGLALLAERGAIDVDAPLADYVEDLPEHWHDLTARQLAAHTAGVRHYRGAEIHSSVHYASLRKALRIFRDDRLLFDPGTKRSYTTYGYTLLGVAMEAAAGEEFVPWMQRAVFAPTGMRHTVVDDVTALIPDRAEPYVFSEDRRIVHAPPTDHSYKIPGGGYLSTAEDLVQFAGVLCEPGWLGEATIAMLFEPATSADGNRYPYAMGWAVGRDVRGRRSFGHGGSQPGCRSYLLAYPEERLAVALLTNVSDAPIGKADAAMIAELFRDRRAAEEEAVDPVGSYQLTSEGDVRSARVEIWREGARWVGSGVLGGQGAGSPAARHPEFPSIRVDGNRVLLIGVGKDLFELELELDGDRVQALARRGTSRMEFTGERSRAPW